LVNSFFYAYQLLKKIDSVQYPLPLQMHKLIKKALQIIVRPSMQSIV